ncbi:MAG: hypothetical protein WC117_00195 [Sphaerochaetaceae bacterium]
MCIICALEESLINRNNAAAIASLAQAAKDLDKINESAMKAQVLRELDEMLDIVREPTSEGQVGDAQDTSSNATKADPREQALKSVKELLYQMGVDPSSVEFRFIG